MAYHYLYYNMFTDVWCVGQEIVVQEFQRSFDFFMRLFGIKALWDGHSGRRREYRPKDQVGKSAGTSVMIVQVFVNLSSFLEIIARIPLLWHIEGPREVAHN
jgi:hypothetical protein